MHACVIFITSYSTDFYYCNIIYFIVTSMFQKITTELFFSLSDINQVHNCKFFPVKIFTSKTCAAISLMNLHNLL